MARIVRTTQTFGHDYVALSYCWGGKHAWWINYVKECQHNPECEVRIGKMPQTLQDAVASCVALGFTYLWIDCLCILQGNKQDWLAEGSKMCDIYGNAALTIAASDSKDCRDGFLARRSRLEREGVVIPFADDSGKLDVGPWLDEHGVFRSGRYQGKSCTSVREKSSLSVDQRPFPGNLRQMYNVLSWCGIVEDYTRRDLAFPEDKLVAIAGLARRAQQILGGDYLAGLWKNRFHIGLAWQIPKEMVATRAPVYRAPSWSWASMDGPVSYDRSDGFVQSDDCFLESAITVLDARVSLTGLDPFGPVQYADVVVTGQLKHIAPGLLLHNDILKYPDWKSGSATQIGWYLEDEKADATMDGEMSISCLKTAVKPFGPGPSLPPTNSMLILERVDADNGDEPPRYRRIGFGQVFVTDYFADCLSMTITLI
ncbi:hypothetical protein LTR99_010724 [Exophiala xenobiotica]|uniref:Heterokaryon incompatibility domain-containing protein n=1 Tax=Vermiconidia calcicola TaxID=1690605 RepID=A0AAV9Q6D0_9PEZI|nr:hypothetical protein LTR92_007203 [Exophiala xenobiotica]KAK5533934.1 hypothetical protein LTR25_006914 [Vermiconidia calcicola]KAK5546485.1 hypothetical protein LTR23_003590 [Chaetothyriales sp. CCFEE 6169]KAK5272172.1 hypothetical protein LTR96_001802 [Exophiala xenobiotica]KAK5291871.1 hypothetical protein LTR99_010724 [Exophiala xenobiotica]